MHAPHEDLEHEDDEARVSANTQATCNPAASAEQARGFAARTKRTAKPYKPQPLTVCFKRTPS